MPDRDRLIFHIDVNSAFLSWTALERLAQGDSVDLRTIPAIVGGDTSTRHGVVLAKSIPAKAFGITTGEPVVNALRKCPHLVMASPEEAPVFKEKEGQYRIYVMLPFDAGRNFEIYQGELDGKAQMESESYGEQTWEYLTVVSGEIELILDDQSFHVKRGSSLYFACDRKHVYRNAGEEKAVCNMIITTQH